MLNITILFFLVVSIIYSIINGNISELSQAALNSSTSAVELTLELAGSMALWGGVMEVASKSGLTKKITKILNKLLSPIFKGLNQNGKALQAISLNVTANLLGIGNAATPLGICAMKELVKEEHANYTTRNVALLVLLNTASIQLLPLTVSTLRAKYGSLSPWDCTLPVIINSLSSVLVGYMAVCLLFRRRQKSNELFRNNSTSSNLYNSSIWCREKS